METISQVSQNEQIMQIFHKVMPLLNKKHSAQFETELRKSVPTENSEVTIKAGVEDKLASISIFVSYPLPIQKAKDRHFDQIIPLWLAKTNEEGRNIMHECIVFREGCEGNEYGKHLYKSNSRLVVCVFMENKE